MKSFVFIASLALLASGPAWAEPSVESLDGLRQQIAQLTQLVQQLNTTVQAQQQRLTVLERAGGSAVATASAPPVVAPVPSSGGGANLSVFNPEIGVVGDLVGQLSSSAADADGNRKISARQVELVVGHAVDPYARFDATVGLSETGTADLEEAYLTHWGLPGDLRLRVGRLKPRVGKATASHLDSLDTVDEPLVVSRYFGSEGLSRTGIELSRFLPLPWETVTHELTVGFMEGGVGEGGTLFGSRRTRPSLYAHLKNFWDVNDTTNVELGTTYLAGSRGADPRFDVNALGIDATLVHFVTPTNKLKWQSEAYLQRRDGSFHIAADGTRTDFNSHPWGVYSLVDYRLSPRVGLGGRFDYVQPVDLDPSTRVRAGDTAWSGYVTLYQSEFARWRLQYRHTDFASGGSDNTVFVQGTVAIGVHKHALQ